MTQKIEAKIHAVTIPKWTVLPLKFFPEYGLDIKQNQPSWTFVFLASDQLIGD